MTLHVYMHVWSGKDQVTRERASHIYGGLMHEINHSGLGRAAKLAPSRSDADNELPTLAWLHYGAQQMPDDDAILYLHLKGSSWDPKRRETPCIDDWRDLMTYFCITRWQEAVKKLVRAKAAGCNVSTAHKPHFSGNFWWARASAIKALPKPSYEWDRMEGEFWIGGVGLPHMESLHQSGVDHYFQRYPRMSYAPEMAGAP